MIRKTLLGILLFGSLSAQAIVIRHDVKPDKYIIAEGPSALVDMRHEGHGVLIAPDWVVTAAHTVFYDYRDKTISIAGHDREIESVIFHSGYSKPPEGIFQGDAAPSQAYLRANHDIALIKLKEPVTDVAPIKIYADEELGEIVTLFGRGNTGDGNTGQIEDTKGTLRRAQNTIAEVRGQWLHYRFDKAEAALPLEGFQGNGDSGGPAIIRKDGIDYLAGLAAWSVYEGDLSDFKGSVYGMTASLVRLSYYKKWMNDIMSWPEEKRRENHYKINQSTK